MKPEHAQEIYEMLVQRAKKLLGLERPDVLEKGTIVECVSDIWKGDISGHEPDYFLAWWEGDMTASQYLCDDKNTISYFEVWKWRYPGEKEWRE